MKNPDNYYYGSFLMENDEAEQDFSSQYNRFENELFIQKLWPNRKDLYHVAMFFFTLGVLYGESGMTMEPYRKETA